MSAIRLPLLCAFAGGCLSNVVLFGLWRAADGAGSSPLKQQHRAQTVVELVASAAPSVQAPTVLAAAKVAELDRHDPALAAQDPESAAPAPAGSAVSDVLMGLEAAYRERVAAPTQPPPAQLPPTQDRFSAASPAANAAAEPASDGPAQTVAEVTPPPPPMVPAAALEPRAVAPAAVAPIPPAPAAVAGAPVPTAPPDSAAPAYASQDAPFPSVIHYGDVNQNTYITNIQQGDVYQIQLQQLAILQYARLLGGSSGVASPARRAGGGAHQRTAFSSGITNPDNPWGFNFSPPNLVR